jgi:hypothetical protein
MISIVFWNETCIKTGILECLLLLCAGWGYTRVSAKVLTMYQIYHTWIHPLNPSLLSLLPWLHMEYVLPWKREEGVGGNSVYTCK